MDNRALISINGIGGFCDGGGSWQRNTQVMCDVLPYLVSGVNDIKFYVTNKASPGAYFPFNPAGLMYKLNIQAAVQ